jgi:uncharacterized protein YdhG (YjbR/CyaY superfamily)
MSEPTTKDTKKSTKSSKKGEGFSAEERAAMKERSKELKANASKAEAENAVLEKIAEMSELERDIATRLHDIIKTNAPDLAPKLWYGMPAYAKDGKILCFFQSAEKFGTRYATLGFNDVATLDHGAVFPVAYAIKGLTATEEAKIAEIVKKAVGT